MKIIQKSTFAEKLVREHGIAKRFAPVKAWVIREDKPVKVEVTMLRGSSDYYESRADYSETTDRSVVSSMYLFDGRYAKPVLHQFEDGFGPFKDWAQIRK